MNRRAFLGTLAAGVAGLALDPERLLWVPGQKTIFLPSEAPTLVSPIGLARGDVFSIAGVYAVNPMTGRTTEHLMNFVITSDVKAGKVDIAEVMPRPIHRGEWRNVNRWSGKNTVQPFYAKYA